MEAAARDYKGFKGFRGFKAGWQTAGLNAALTTEGYGGKRQAATL